MTEQQFTTEELNSEEWKAVSGYEGLYEVSNLGRFRSLQFHGKARLRILRPCAGNRGYIVVSLYRELKSHSYNAHVLVAQAFVLTRRPDQNQVNHKDLNKTNNRACNLEWNTAKEDAAHRVAHGHVGRGETHGSRTKPHRVPRGDRHGTVTKPHRVARGDRNGMRLHPESVQRGSKNGSSKLTELDVVAIRKAFDRIGSYRAVGKQFNVSETNVTRIIKRQSWKHVQ